MMGERQAKQQGKAPLKLNYKNTFLIGFGFLASSLAWSLYNSFVPLILESRFLQSTTLIGLIMTIDNFFGIIFQPLVGVLSDKTQSRFGKRMPWIAVGLPSCALLFFFIPRMEHLGTTMAVIIAFNFIMSLWRSPVIALMPDVTPSHLRSSANGIINLMGGVGSVLAFLLGGRLANLSGGHQLPFAMGTVMMLLALVALLFFVREPAALLFKAKAGQKLSPRESLLLARYEREQILDGLEPALAGQAAALEVGTEPTALANCAANAASAAAESAVEALAEAAAPEAGLNLQKKIHGFRNLDASEKRSLLALLAAIFFWFCGYNAVETFFTLFASKNLGLSHGSATALLTAYSLSFLLFAIPAGFLAQKIGRKKLIIIGLLGLMASFIPILLVENVTLLMILLVLGGLFWACININSLPMVVEMAQREAIGSFTGYYYFFSFAAAIVSPILFGFIRDLTQNYSSLFVYAVSCFALALLSMLRVKHGDSKDTF